MRSLRWMIVGLCCVLFAGCMDKTVGVDWSAQLLADMETIDQYLADNNITAYEDKSGIRFHITELGTGGLPPKMEQTIKVSYQGKFMNGNVFDPGGDATGVLNSYIDGWRAGLILWPVGTKGTLYVPSPLGYGDQQVGSIPPNSILIFDVWLKGIDLTNVEKARFASDVQIIDEYLEDNSIDAVEDTTGVRYVITQQGSGPAPTWYTKCKFAYSGKVLSSGVEFFSGTAQPTETFDSRVIDYLHGIKVGLSKIGVGGKITVYVPSGLAFGNTSAGNVPTNANVIYQIELQEIVP